MLHRISGVLVTQCRLGRGSAKLVAQCRYWWQSAGIGEATQNDGTVLVLLGHCQSGSSVRYWWHSASKGWSAPNSAGTDDTTACRHLVGQ